MIESTSSINCSPIKPSFKSNKTDIMNAASELIRDTKSLDDLDEDKFARIRDVVENIEVDPNSKVQGPMKTFLLTSTALATGALLTKGTANKLFYLVKDKGFAQNGFKKLTEKLLGAQVGLAQKAELTTSKFKKFVLNATTKGLEALETLGTKKAKTAKGQAGYLNEVGENIVKKVIDTTALAAGTVTTGAGLAVDKDKNGKSDILEINKRKSEQEAITNLAAAVLDAV